MRFFLLLSILFISVFSQAQPEERSIQFHLSFNDQPLEIGKTYYFSSIADSITFESIRFYISNLRLSLQDQIIDNYKNEFWLLDAEVPGSMKIALETDRNSTFDQILFNLGIDSLTNVAGAMGGNLDPTKGMYWSWQSGYINFKLEGVSPICPSRKNRFQFHIGGYQPPFNTLQKIELKILNTDELNIYIAIDKLLAAIDLKETYQLMSPNQKAVAFAHLLPSIFSL